VVRGSWWRKLGSSVICMGSAAAGRVHLGLVRWCLAVLEGELCGVVSG